MNGKWAICLSGHLRTWEQTARSFRRFLQKPCDADVFVHTWTSRDFSSRTWWRPEQDRVEPEADPSTIRAKLEKHYNLTGFQCETPIDFKRPEYEAWKQKTTGVLAENIVSMLYSAKQSYQLLRDHEEATGTKYGMIIKTRADIQFFDRTHFQDIEEGCVHAIKKFDWLEYGPVGDLFSFGSAQDMAVVFNFYDHIHEYLKPENFSGIKIVPEVLLGKYLRDQGVTVKEIPMGIALVRGNGSRSNEYPCLLPRREKFRRKVIRALNLVRTR